MPRSENQTSSLEDIIRDYERLEAGWSAGANAPTDEQYEDMAHKLRTALRDECGGSIMSASIHWHGCMTCYFGKTGRVVRLDTHPHRPDHAEVHPTAYDAIQAGFAQRVNIQAVLRKANTEGTVVDLIQRLESESELWRTEAA